MSDLSYHALPDDPLTALNILRAAGGLPPYDADKPDKADDAEEDPDGS